MKHKKCPLKKYCYKSLNTEDLQTLEEALGENISKSNMKSDSFDMFYKRIEAIPRVPKNRLNLSCIVGKG